ncbi:MAG TPA: EAL domain-containing protein [Vicinamibacterales bacterium]|nr:EAL domain-containing protein [Vicinamibacterales bacterium]
MSVDEVTALPARPTLAGALAHDVEPLTSDAPCERAREAFSRDAGLFAVPVVDAAMRPIGLVNRFKFLERLASRFGRELTVKKPVSLLMETDPLILDYSTNIDELGSRLLAQQHQHVFDGFIVTRDGVYAGVGTGLDLIRALTERRHAELHRMAHHDMLTGLPNRALFEQALAYALSQATATDGLAVLFVDLDRFKEVNDTYGHRFGDLVLCAISQRMQAALRKSDTVARLSGDEFALVLPGIRAADDAEAIAKVLLSSCRAPITIDGREVIVSCSIGLSIYPEDGVTQEGLVRHADAAQYHAKEVRNSWQRYSAEMEKWRPLAPGLSALRQAIEAGVLEVHYQPIASLATGQVTGVEALVRWTHADFGAVAASDIVRLAEDSGLIVPLTEYVLRSALAQMQRWDAATGRTDLRLSINISAVQIHEGGLVAMVDRLLAEGQFDPRRLEVELTERAAMRASVSALSTLHGLKQRGIALTLDDFGTGYSALSRLERLPIDALKIDKSFLESIGQPDDGVIARAIIAMGRALGVRIVGEGVETPEQLAFLRQEGCDCVQGYLIARPMPGDQLQPLLTSVSTVFT